MTSSPQSIGRSLPALRVGRVAAHPAVVATMVAVAAGIAHLAVALERLSPRYLPDEFLYSQLARSLGTGKGVGVLGQPSPFPALLEPLLTAPLWIPGNAETAYRLTQSLHALAMSAAGIPIYLLARRLGLSSWAAVSAVAISAVAPGLIYIGYVTADALAYLIALSAFAVGVRALDTGTKRSQLCFLALGAAAVFARAQYGVVFVAFVLAALLVERGRVRLTVRRFSVISWAAAVAGAGLLAAGPSLLGRYEAVTTFRISWDTGRWAAATVLLLTIGAGVVLVPGAVTWLGTTLVRPRDRTRSAFAAFATTLAVCLVLATAVISVDTGSERFFERYLIILPPILTLAFLCWIDERRPARHVTAGIAALIVALASLVPLSGYADGQGRADSPTLLAVSRLSESIGIGDASLAAALVVTVAALVAATLALSRRTSAHLATGTVLIFLTLVSIGAHAGDLLGSQRFQERSFAASPRWVDATGAADVLLLQTAYSGNAYAMITSFWNTSVTGITQLGAHTDPVDGMGQRVHLASDGTIVDAHNHPIRRPILMATSGTAAAFPDSTKVVAERTFALVRSEGPIRFVALAEGVRADGTLAPVGRIVAFPLSSGHCSTATVTVAVPDRAPATTLRLKEAGRTRTIRIDPGATRTVSVTSHRTSGRSIMFEGAVAGSGDGRVFLQSIARAHLSARTARCASTTQG